MSRTKKKLRAIDLYSGVGGWSLGLKLAGIEVVSSYEAWTAANLTNSVNNGHQTETINIREMRFDLLPKDINIIVGSPPCTQFSYSNRGGNGDIGDGLVDIKQFLAIVDYLKPKFWVMENVPRVAGVLEREFGLGGVLQQYAHLNCSIRVLNFAAFGLPQKRRRCIAGNLDFDLLESYAKESNTLTLGNVIGSLSRSPAVDPIYGMALRKTQLHDHAREDFLDEEEVRINRAAKVYHPVYNSMVFPDRLDRPVRTITATCTRVSRESIVIAESKRAETFRRLTVRERASLQGFPLSFQFYSSSYQHKLRMIGNALPPIFSFYVGQALLRIPPESVKRPTQLSDQLPTDLPKPAVTKPSRSGSRFSESRTFRFAIPSLILKSGVRFELRNMFEAKSVRWEVAFFFGTSKSIHMMSLAQGLFPKLLSGLPAVLIKALQQRLDALRAFIRASDVTHLQQVWCHRGPGGLRPFKLLDRLDDDARAILTMLADYPDVACKIIKSVIRGKYGTGTSRLKGLDKLERNSHKVLAGFLIALAANKELRPADQNEPLIGGFGATTLPKSASN